MYSYIQKFKDDPDCFAANTKYNYCIAIKQYLDWTQDNQLDWLDNKTIKKWFDHLELRGAKLSTLRLKLAALRYFFNFCLEEGFISEIPNLNIELEAVVLEKKPIMTDTEVLTLCECTESDRDRAMIQTMVDTGLRSSELCNLNIADFDLNAPNLKIAPGKNKTARNMPLTYESAALIKKYLGTRTDSDPALFITRLGKRFTRQSLHKLFKKYVRISRIQENYSSHSCRWRFGTKLADNEFKLQEVANLMGHLWLQSAKRYIHKSEDKQAEIHHKFYQD